MKLYQVRKGQFVYFNNELHKVYSVKAMFKKSVHMYRLKDMNQVLTRAEEIELCKPQPNESFIFYGKRYTLQNDKMPEVDDYILITKPAPEFLDHYSLNEIEKVAKVEDRAVITTRDNAVRRQEFLVMKEGELEGSKDIAYKNRSIVPEDKLKEEEHLEEEVEPGLEVVPSVGDIYFHTEKQLRTMVVGITEHEVILGHGERVSMEDLNSDDKWTLVFNTTEGNF